MSDPRLPAREQAKEKSRAREASFRALLNATAQPKPKPKKKPRQSKKFMQDGPDPEATADLSPELWTRPMDSLFF